MKLLKKLTSLLLVLTLVMSIISIQAEEAKPQGVTIQIVHTNDTHSRVLASKTEIGFATIATLVKNMEAENPNTLVVDLGDALHGQTFSTLSRGESIVNLFNKIGYDIMVPGNHDFNYGQDRLLELRTFSQFSIITANVKKSDNNYLPGYVIKEIGGKKIAFFGLTTPETAYKTSPKNVEGLTFKDPILVAKEMVTLLKPQADVIVCLAHIGLDSSSEVTSSKLAEQVTGIDVILDGHSHTVLKNGLKVGNTLIASAGEYDQNLGVVTLTIDGTTVTSTAKLITKADTTNVVEDPAILKYISDINTSQAKVLDEVVGSTDIALNGERAAVRAGETNLGNLITNAMGYVTKADCAITNGGGIRASIPKGNITKGNIITVLPFGNYIVTKELTGQAIKDALEHGTKGYPSAAGSFPHVYGMTFTLDGSKAIGNRIVDLKIQGVPVDLSKKYVVATNDFMAIGGDDYKMFIGTKTINEFPGLDEAVIEYIKSLQKVSLASDKRITIIEPPVVTTPSAITTIPAVTATLPAVVATVPAVVAPVTPVSTPTAIDTTPIIVVVPTVTPPTPPKTPIEYVVKKGDVLWKIAKKYGTTWQQLQILNKLTNPNALKVNQKIIVPNPN